MTTPTVRPHITLAARLPWVDQFEQAAHEYVTLERIITRPITERTPAVWGPTVWASRLTPNQRNDLAADYRHGLAQTLTARNARALTRDICGWKAFARSL